MSSQIKRIEKNIDSNKIIHDIGKKPKHRCPKCKKITLFVKDKGILKCIRCGKCID